MGLTSFILTFFLAEAYTLWRDIYTKGHDIQSHSNDISLLASTRAERNPLSNKFTPCALKTLDDVAGCVQLFNALMWSSFARKYRIL